jgi:cytochrome c oxidase subunit 2
MNKFIIIGIVLVLVVAGGIFYRTFLLAEEDKPVDTGVVREITIVAKKDQWRFEPSDIEMNQGDNIVMTLINEDAYDHGIGIDAFGVSQRMPANSTITVKFVVTQAGEFPFFCSIPCGEGHVDGVKRTHFDMIGKLRVQSLISETK